MSESVSSQVLSSPVNPPPAEDLVVAAQQSRAVSGSVLTASEDLLLAGQQIVGQLSALLERARIANQSIADERAASATALAECQAKANEVSSVATLATAAKAQITDEQAVIAKKSAHINDAQQHADKVRSDLDRALTAATQQVTEIEGLGARAQTTADGVAELLTQARTTKGAIDNDAAAVVATRDSAKGHAEATKDLADKASTLEARINDYEEQLAALKAQSEAQLRTITELLPGATSAGLAHAFDKRRQTFIDPRRHWQQIFVGSVIALVALAGTGLWQVYTNDATMTFDKLLLLWLARLPIAGALVWLALHASHESALAKRLEEDYGYKAAIATSYQGFQKQMNEIGATLPDSPLAKLCSDTLITIASPPGRIYDKHRTTATPTGELTDVTKTLMDLAGAKSKSG